MSQPPELRLANDILVQFAHLPDAEATEKVAHHIRMFWDPRMRARLNQLAGTTDDVDPRLGEVVRLLGDA